MNKLCEWGFFKHTLSVQRDTRPCTLRVLLFILSVPPFPMADKFTD